MKKLALVLLIVLFCFPLACCGDGNTAIPAQTSEYTYVINKSSKIFHYTDCYSAELIKESNRKYTNDRPSSVYKPCGNCNP